MILKIHFKPNGAFFKGMGGVQPQIFGPEDQIFLEIFDPKLKIVPSNFEKYTFDNKFQTWWIELKFLYTFHKIGGGVNPWCNKCFTF